MTVTAKVRLTRVNDDNPEGGPARQVGLSFSPDYEDGANSAWAHYTPTLSVQMTVRGEVADGRFFEGQRYTLSFDVDGDAHAVVEPESSTTGQDAPRDQVIVDPETGELRDVTADEARAAGYDVPMTDPVTGEQQAQGLAVQQTSVTSPSTQSQISPVGHEVAPGMHEQAEDEHENVTGEQPSTEGDGSAPAVEQPADCVGTDGLTDAERGGPIDDTEQHAGE